MRRVLTGPSGPIQIGLKKAGGRTAHRLRSCHPFRQQRTVAAYAEAEKIEYARPSDLPGVETLWAERSPRLWRVFHETYTICAALSGYGGLSRWTYRAKTHHTAAGDLMFMEPGELHVTNALLGSRFGTFRVLCIAPSVVEHAARELGMRPAQPHLTVAGLTDPMLFQAFTRLHASLEHPCTVLERQARFATCLRLLLERCAESPPPSHPTVPGRTALKRAREFIQVSPSDTITLDALVAVTGLSRFHLVRAFAAEYGLPPHAYHLQVRLARARALLTAGVPVSTVAAETGFADQSHLTRHFTQAFGVTPGQYSARGAAWLQPRDDPACSPDAGMTPPWARA